METTRERDTHTHAIEFEKNRNTTPHHHPPHKKMTERERHTLTCRTAVANGQWTVVKASPTMS